MEALIAKERARESGELEDVEMDVDAGDTSGSTTLLPKAKPKPSKKKRKGGEGDDSSGDEEADLAWLLGEPESDVDLDDDDDGRVVDALGLRPQADGEPLREMKG